VLRRIAREKQCKYKKSAHRLKSLTGRAQRRVRETLDQSKSGRCSSNRFDHYSRQQLRIRLRDLLKQEFTIIYLVAESAPRSLLPFHWHTNARCTAAQDGARRRSKHESGVWFECSRLRTMLARMRARQPGQIQRAFVSCP